MNVERLAAAIHLESAAIAPQTTPLIEAAKEALEMLKQPRQHNDKHLKFVRGLPCCVCGDNTSTEAAHIRMADPMIAKGGPGMQAKPDDKFTVPLCGKCHRSQHAMNEDQWWEIAELDPVKIALAIYSVSGDHEQGERIALRQ